MFLSSQAAGGVLSFLTKGAGSKMIFLVVCIWVLSAAVSLISTLLPAMIPTDFLGGLPSYFFYFMGMMQLHVWLTVVLGVRATKWAIRRIPFIGG